MDLHLLHPPARPTSQPPSSPRSRPRQAAASRATQRRSPTRPSHPRTPTPGAAAPRLRGPAARPGRSAARPWSRWRGRRGTSSSSRRIRTGGRTAPASTSPPQTGARPQPPAPGAARPSTSTSHRAAQARRGSVGPVRRGGRVCVSLSAPAVVPCVAGWVRTRLVCQRRGRERPAR